MENVRKRQRGWKGCAFDPNRKTKVAGHSYLYRKSGKLSALCPGKSISDHDGFRKGRERGTDCRKTGENNPAASLIWLSDEKNALEFWKLHANAFGLFPPDREQLEEFLTDCLSRTERPGRIGKLQEEYYEKTI